MSVRYAEIKSFIFHLAVTWIALGSIPVLIAIYFCIFNLFDQLLWIITKSALSSTSKAIVIKSFCESNLFQSGITSQFISCPNVCWNQWISVWNHFMSACGGNHSVSHWMTVGTVMNEGVFFRCMLCYSLFDCVLLIWTGCEHHKHTITHHSTTHMTHMAVTSESLRIILSHFNTL